MMGTLGIIAFLLIAFAVRSYVSNELLSKRPSRLDHFYFGILIAFIVIWLFSNHPFYSLLDYNRYIPFKEFTSQNKFHAFLSHVYKDYTIGAYSFVPKEIIKSLLQTFLMFLPITLSLALLQIESPKRRSLYYGLILGLLILTSSNYPLGTFIILYLIAVVLSFSFKLLLQRFSNLNNNETFESNSARFNLKLTLSVLPLVLFSCAALYISWPTFSNQFEIYTTTASYQEDAIPLEGLNTLLLIPFENFSMVLTDGSLREHGAELNMNFNVESSPIFEFPYSIDSRNISFLTEINGETQSYGGNHYTYDYKLSYNSHLSNNDAILNGSLSLKVNNFSVPDFKFIPIKAFKLLGISDITFVINDASLLDQFEVISSAWVKDASGYPNYEVQYRIPNDPAYEFNWNIYNETYPSDDFYTKMSNKAKQDFYVGQQTLQAYSNDALLVSKKENEKIYRVNYYYYDQYQGVLSEQDIKDIRIKPVSVYYNFWSEEKRFEEPLILDFSE